MIDGQPMAAGLSNGDRVVELVGRAAKLPPDRLQQIADEIREGQLAVHAAVVLELLRFLEDRNTQRPLLTHYINQIEMGVRAVDPDFPTGLLTDAVWTSAAAVMMERTLPHQAGGTAALEALLTPFGMGPQLR